MNLSITKVFALAIFCVFLNGWTPDSCHAQDVGSAGFEGYVFDVERGSPLANVVVRITVVPDAGSTVDVTAVTDGNGFYAFEYPFSTPGSNMMRTICTTKKGIVETLQPVYRTLRAERYIRNFYIRLPKRQTACQ